MRSHTESAVSPVVGIMMMLVVVIIIAAVVSGFAGSLVVSNEKAPQATIQGKYSVSSGILQMYHAGGDELATQSLFITIRLKDAEWGGFQGSMAKPMTNKSFIVDSSGQPWIDSTTGLYKVKVWRPGEMMYNNQSISNLKASDDVGKTFTLEVDTIDGKLVSKSDVKIDP